MNYIISKHKINNYKCKKVHHFLECKDSSTFEKKKAKNG